MSDNCWIIDSVDADQEPRSVVFDLGMSILLALRQRSVQLILAYSWARPAILVAGKGRGGMFLVLLFLYFHSCSHDTK